MKPLKLTLNGINSYRQEQTVDFARLTSAGLFGIFGPTGSGKSTILDAVTLALYARLPRSTKNFIHIHAQSASVEFLFSITTTTTRIYQVERIFRYPKGGSANTVRNVSARLAELTDGDTRILADRPTEVTQACITLLGLTADDFMKTVVLPQGQFSEFLKLKNAERRGMLQRIFHLEEYGLELTQKIAAARQKQELLLSNLEGQLQMYASITPDAVSQTEQQQKAAFDALAALTKKKESQEGKVRNLEELRSLWLEYEPVRQACEAALQKLPEKENQKETLSLYQKASRLQPFARQKEQAEADRTAAQTQWKEAEAKKQQASVFYETAETARAKFLSTYETNYEAHKERKQLLSSAMERSNSIAEWKKKRSALADSAQKEQAVLEQLLRQKEALAAQQEQFRADMTKKEAEQEKAHISPEKMAALEQGHLAEQHYREKKEQYDRAKALFAKDQEKHRFLQEQIQQEQGHLAEAADQAACHRQAFLQAREAGRQALEKAQQQQQHYKRRLEELQQQHMALLLRETLADGSPCPVCGNTHPLLLPAGQPPEQLEDIRRCQQQLEQLETAISRLTAEQTTWEQMLTLLEHGLETAAPHLPAAASAHSLEPPQSLPSPEEEKALVNRLQTGALAYQGKQGQLSELSAQAKQQALLLEEQHTWLQQEAASILQLRTRWEIDNFTTKRTEAALLTQKEEQLQQDIKQLRQQREQLSAQQEALAGRILEQSNRLSSLESEQNHYSLWIKQESEKFPDGLTAQMDYPSLLQRIQGSLSELEQEKKAWDTKVTHAQEELQNARELLSAARASLDSCEKTVQQAEASYEEQYRLSGLPADFAFSSYYRTPEELSALETELQDFFASLTETRNRLVYLERKRQNRTFSPEAWEEAGQALQQLDAAVEEKEREHTILTQTLLQQQEQLDKKKELESQLEQALHRRSIIRELEQLFKGNAFIEYVAKSRLQYIAAEASDILGEISNGAYALEINELSEFIIRDNKNGGALRPCDTLSGGETFLTSLALALALSSGLQLNNTAPLELFFLDEGFGSLDEELLDVVMFSLEHLQNSRRCIGIITHVEAIQARVPVKLVVTPSDITQNGSTLRLEYS